MPRRRWLGWSPVAGKWRRWSRTQVGAGSSNCTRKPPSGLSLKPSEPPYTSASSVAMCKPRPEPGADSSSRVPRVSAARRCSGAMPGPSSSMVIRSRLALALRHHRHLARRPPPGVVQQVAQHVLQVLNFARKQRVSRRHRCEPTQPAPRMDLAHHPQQARHHRRHRGALPGQALGGASPGARQLPVELAACAITASGVLSACARLPAWVRARAVASALRSSTALKSCTSGCNSSGNRPCSRGACPLRTRLSAPSKALSGASPTVTWASAASTSSPPQRGQQQRQHLVEATHRLRGCCQVAAHHQAPARAHQRLAQLAAQGGLVFNQQQSHGRTQGAVCEWA